MKENTEQILCDALYQIVQLLESIERVSVEASKDNKRALAIAEKAEEQFEQTRE